MNPAWAYSWGIASNIDRSYEQVQEGLRAFLDQQRQTAGED